MKIWICPTHKGELYTRQIPLTLYRTCRSTISRYECKDSKNSCASLDIDNDTEEVISFCCWYQDLFFSYDSNEHYYDKFIIEKRTSINPVSELTNNKSFFENIFVSNNFFINPFDPDTDLSNLEDRLVLMRLLQ